MIGTLAFWKRLRNQPPETPEDRRHYAFIQYVEVAGWGGGPGCVGQIIHKGRFYVKWDNKAQMLRFDVTDGTRTQQFSERVFHYQTGQKFWVHPSQIREMR